MAHVISTECIECGSCQGECPTESISEGTPYSIDPATCTDCADCVAVCPVDAISPGV